MKKIYLISILIFSVFLFSGCQTVKKKTDSIVEKENQKLSKFIGKSSNELRLDLGAPDEDYINEKGNMELFSSKNFLAVTVVEIFLYFFCYYTISFIFIITYVFIFLFIIIRIYIRYV